jgi:localization factor PodJL
MLETRLDSMAQSVSQMVGEARDEIGAQVHAALEGVQSEGLEEALADVNRRLAAAERRQAQTIEAISIEIKRMSETVDKRLRAVEARNDDAAASAVREELSRMASTLEHRFDEIERREAAAFDRMGLEVGRLSERLEERVGAVEGRSAQAIEQVGEQVARMAERFNQRHELLARELGERMIDSEERAGARVSEAISSIMQRLSEVELSSQEAIAPVQNALSSVASKLDQFQSREPEPPMPTPSRRVDDFDSFGDVVEDDEPYVSPMDAAQPLRAAPITPAASAQSEDIYFSDDIDLETSDPDDDLLAELDPPVSAAALAVAAQPAPPIEPPTLDTVFKAPLEDTPTPEAAAIDDIDLDDFADDLIAPPPEDDDPFWTPDSLVTATGPKPDTVSLADTAVNLTPADEPTTIEPAGAALFEDEIAAPATTKNDYLAAARKAAQAQSQPKGKATTREVPPTPTYSLRGSSRIVLWGAASAIALVIAGGAWYLNNQREAPAEPVEPAPPPPNHALAPPPSENFDPNQPFGAPVEDPAQQGEGGALTPQEPASAVAAPPVAAPQSARQVAGPLPARNVSLEQAAQTGDIVAQYELALQRIAAGRSADGVSLLRRSADRGLAMAQYRLAKLYERGEGVPADLTMARQWTERAAAAGILR